MKNIFTKTLTLIAFLSLSIGVWGGQYDLDFLFTKTGASTKEDVQAYTNCSSYEDKDKAIMDSDWEWNTGKDDLENKGSFVSLKNGPKACSHIEYEFPAGNVTVKLYAHFTSNDGIASFPVKIGAYTCNFDALSQDGPHSSNDYTYEGTINVEYAGTYRITVDFPNTDKMQISHMTFDYAGGPTPTPTNFTAGQTIFFRSNGEGAWKDNACVITEYSNNWNNKQTADLYWMYNVGNTDYKMFYGIVPSGTYDRVQLHRYAANKCYSTTPGDYWNDAGWVSVDGSKNTFYSKGAGGSDGEWYSTNYEMYLKGSINWTPNLATFTDQLNGDFAASYNNFQPSATSYDFRVYDNNGQGFGDGNTTLSGLNTNSTYNITASFNIGSRGTLNLAKTFVKGKVTFNANGRGTAPSALDNVLAGAKLEEPEMEDVDHYYVEGWYKESGCTNKWNFATDEVTESMTLYAKWVAVPQYNITASADPSDKGSVTGGGTYYRGETVTLTATPTTGYEFVEWSDHNTENPRIFTASENLTLTATFKKSTKVCTNTLTWEAEDESKMISPTGVTTCEYYKDKHCDGNDASSMVSSASDGHFISMKQNASADSKCIYYHFSTSETADLAFTIRAGGFYNNKSATIILYSTKQPGSQIFTYDDKSYKKVSEQVKALEGSDQTWNDVECTFTNQPADDYVVAVHSSEHYWTIYFDKFTITASENVFCTEAPAVTTWSVYGNFDGDWKDYEMTDGVVTISNLGRASNYQFKLRKTSDEGENYTYYGAQNEVNNMTSSNCTNWTLTNTNDGYDINITTGATGSYTFTATDLTGDSPNLSVTYPTAYSITFDDNDADGGTDMTNITNIASGGSETLPAMTRTKTDYHFTGWKDASSNDYADGATIENITSNIVLTAQWEKAVTGITITAAGGLNEIEEGMQLQLSVVYTPEDAVYGREITWTSENANYLTVDQNGLVTGVMAGSNHYITATTSNGKSNTYTIKVNPSTCTSHWKVHMWNTSGTNTSICLEQVGSSTEWRTRQITLPSNSDAEKVKVLYDGGDGMHGKEWTTRWIPMVGFQEGKCDNNHDGDKYAGQDAIGYLRIFDNSEFDNNYLGFQPIYAANFGIEGQDGTWHRADFAASGTSTVEEYYSEQIQVPVNRSSYTIYVGPKTSTGGVNVVGYLSKKVAMNTIPGLTDNALEGKYGFFRINANYCDESNFNCNFVRVYQMSYNGNGGTGTIEPQYISSLAEGDAQQVTLSANAFERTGYTFQYYTTDQAGTSTHFNPGSKYSLNASTGDVTMYAQWQAKTYTITLDKGTQGTSDGSATATFDSNTLTNLTHVGTPTGYTLDGYYTDEEDGTKVIAADGTLQTNVTDYTDAEGNWIKDADCTLYAQWTVNQHKVTINLDGGTIDDGTWTSEGGNYYKMFNFGSTISLPTPTKAGYTFNAWTPAVPETMPDEDVTLTATWKVDYCSNTLRIDCPVDWVKHVDCRANNETKFGTFYSSTGGGWITHHDGDGVGDMYFAYNTSAESEITFNIHVGGLWNDGQAVAYFYNEDENGSLVINDVKYSQDGSSQNIWSGSQHEALKNISIVRTISAGKHILHFHASNYANFDVVDLTASFSVFCPEMYTVTFPQPEHGTVTAAIKDGAAISSGDEVPENTVVVFTASDIAEGYELVNWTDGESHELAGAVNSFEQKITSNITVNANIEEEAEKYTVTVIPGDHGSITSGAGEYREGATVTIVTAPAANYKVGSATASNVDNFTIEGNNVSFTMPAAPVAVTVHFVFDEVHALIITPNSNETYTFGNKEGYATTFNISSATDPTGTFDHNVLKLEYDGMNNNYAGRSISKDAAYTPNAKATGFALWYRTEKSDDGIAFCFQKTDGNQTKWQMQATNGEWRYYYWEDAAAANYATNANFKIYMNGSDGGNTTKYNSGTYYITEIQATNVTEMSPIVPPVDLTVVVSPNEGGTVTTSPETTTGLAKGTEVTLTATPEDNYRFVNWTVNDVEVSTEATYSRIVNATETITANFVRVYSLVVNHDEHIVSVTGEGQYAAGKSVTVTATADQGYKFTNWTEGTAGGTELAITSSYTFSMPATDNYTIYANSEEDIVTYQITLGSCINGTIAATVNDEPYTGTDLTANTPVVLTATPAEGYGFVQWKDGSRENPHTIYANAETEGYNPWTATFAQQFTVTATYGQPGTSVTGGGEYPNGADVTLTANWTLASKDFTYGFKEWIDVTGVNLSDEQKVSNPLSFSMPFANVSMKATFAPVECVDTFVIQCEDDQAYIPWNKQDEDLTKYPNSIPHDGECGPRHDYYKGYHGAGYYDYKKARAAEMYYPIELPASTYKFEIWSASNGYKNCWMNLYIESDDPNPEVVYKGVNYKKTSSVTANNDCGAGGNFAMSGTIDNVVLSSPKSVIIGLYCGEDYGSFDQIKITADDAVFCEEKSIETFTIAANEAKEIPVSGVKNLVIYEGGQATNDDDVEVFETVKYIRSITEANIDQWSTLAVPYTATKTQVSKGGDVDDIYPVWRMENGTEQAGYYFMEVLTNNNPEAIGIESRARWDMSYTQQPQKDSAYITMFPRSQSDGYFIDSEIFYIGDYRSNGGVTLTGSKNAFIENGGWPEEGKPKYYYFPNSAITAIEPYDAYVLSEDGTEFVITDHPTIKPFQCYIQATTEFKELYPRLVIRQNSGGTTDLIPVTADGWNVSGVDKVMIDEVIYVVREGKIYTVMGQLVK